LVEGGKLEKSIRASVVAVSLGWLRTFCITISSSHPTAKELERG